MKRLLLLLVVLFFVLCASVTYAQNPMRVHYINVGQADAILIELPKAAMLIDAGGEKTNDAQLQNHLMTYLTNFFQHRPDLQAPDHRGIIDTIVISHPHIDHTMRLFDVVQAFHVRHLIDGGNQKGSGIIPLQQARTFVAGHGGQYLAIHDDAVTAHGFNVPPFTALHTADPNVTVTLLSASRNCANANNDSLVVFLQYKTHKFIFTGDAEDEADDDCTAEIQLLIDRFSQHPGALHVDVYKADHHGSRNGTDDDWMATLSPLISVISAGQHDPAHRVPDKFHAWQFGHPRLSAVRQMEVGTTGTRPQKDVRPMRAVEREAPIEHITKAVYCTCWDGDIVIDGETLQVRTSQ